MADPDWTDPCAVLAWLRPQYYRLAAGGARIKVRDGDQEVDYGPGDLTRLEAMMSRLESQCARKQGRRVRRAFAAG